MYIIVLPFSPCIPNTFDLAKQKQWCNNHSQPVSRYSCVHLCYNKTFPFPKYAYSYHFASQHIAHSSLLLWFCLGNRLCDSLNFALVTGNMTVASLTVSIYCGTTQKPHINYLKSSLLEYEYIFTMNLSGLHPG